MLICKAIVSNRSILTIAHLTNVTIYIILMYFTPPIWFLKYLNLLLQRNITK